MSYLVLARKYRPRTFAEVCEQESAVSTLRGAIAENRIGHAYLLHGPRGTGKTTMARIFAKALECERGPTPDPCGECEHCRAVDAGNEVDVIEIDAASNNGVDDVRDLREVVAYAPLKARFKIYIVDEVHMMSKAAFNAFLKTLEEPPPHVKFIFATTELEKVIETVRSRCQVVQLSLLREEAIAARLAHVFAAEKVDAEPNVVDELARLARGSMRDALSLGDQLLASSGDHVRVEDVRRLAGAGGPERVEAVLDALEKRDKAAILQSLEHSDGSEGLLVDALLEHLRGCLVALHCGDKSQLFQAEEQERERRARRAERLGSDRLEHWLFVLVGTRTRMHEVANHARIVLELALLDLARADAGLPIAELVERLNALEERLARGAGLAAPRASAAPSSSVAPSVPSSGASPRSPTPTSVAKAPPAASAPSSASSAPSSTATIARPTANPGAPPSANPSATPNPAAPRTTPSNSPPREIRPAPPRSNAGGSANAQAWSAFVAEMRATNPLLGDALARCAKLADVGSNAARLQLSKLKDEDRALFLSDETRTDCESVLARHLGRTLRVVFEDTSKRPPADQDAFTREVAELFQGRVDEN